MRVPQERLPAVSSRRFEHVAAVHAPLLPLPSSCLSLIGVLPISDRKSSGRTLSPHGVGAACAATASRAPAAQKSRSTSRARRTSSSAPHQPRRSRRPGGNRPSHRHGCTPGDHHSFSAAKSQVRGRPEPRTSDDFRERIGSLVARGGKRDGAGPTGRCSASSRPVPTRSAGLSSSTPGIASVPAGAPGTAPSTPLDYRPARCSATPVSTFTSRPNRRPG